MVSKLSAFAQAAETTGAASQGMSTPVAGGDDLAWEGLDARAYSAQLYEYATGEGAEQEVLPIPPMVRHAGLFH